MSDPDKTISVTGQCCPLPLIALGKAVKEMEPGKILQVTGDDPIFEIGVRDFCTAQNLELLEMKQETERKFTALIKC